MKNGNAPASEKFMVWSSTDMQFHVIGIFDSMDNAEAVRDWYEALTNREGEYSVEGFPYNLQIPPESEWPNIYEHSGRKNKQAKSGEPSVADLDAIEEERKVAEATASAQ